MRINAGILGAKARKPRRQRKEFKLTSSGQYVSDWGGDASFLVTPLHHCQKPSNLLLDHRPRKFCELYNIKLLGTTRLFCWISHRLSCSELDHQAGEERQWSCNPRHCILQANGMSHKLIVEVGILELRILLVYIYISCSLLNNLLASESSATPQADCACWTLRWKSAA